MSKLKRKVTVDADERRKPSVFERLGPGAVRRSYENYDDSDSDVCTLHLACVLILTTELLNLGHR